jgi:hypothetical protein
MLSDKACSRQPSTCTSRAVGHTAAELATSALLAALLLLLLL